MLRSDVQQAIKSKKFAIYAVAYVTQALEILCDKPAGTLSNGQYPKNSILYQAINKSKIFWENTRGKQL